DGIRYLIVTGVQTCALPICTSTTTGTSTTTAPTGSPNPNAKAYGRVCRGESKKHVAGQKGTPFSNCVVAMAQLAKSPKMNPHRRSEERRVGKECRPRWSREP